MLNRVFSQVIRLGKKSKDHHDQKKETVDGITRLVCTSRTKNVPLKGKLVVFFNLNYFYFLKIIQFQSFHRRRRIEQHQVLSDIITVARAHEVLEHNVVQQRN